MGVFIDCPRSTRRPLTFPLCAFASGRGIGTHHSFATSGELCVPCTCCVIFRLWDLLARAISSMSFLECVFVCFCEGTFWNKFQWNSPTLGLIPHSFNHGFFKARLFCGCFLKRRIGKYFFHRFLKEGSVERRSRWSRKKEAYISIFLASRGSLS